MSGHQADDSGLGRDALALQPIASAPTHTVNNNRRLSSTSPPPPRQQQQQNQPSTPRNDRRRPTLEDRRQPSIRLRRLGSASTLASQNTTATTGFAQTSAIDSSGRRRSSSEPQRPPWAAATTNNPNSNSLSVPRGTARPASTHMPRLEEEAGRPSTTIPPTVDIERLAAAGDSANLVESARPGLWKRASVAALQPFRRQQQLEDDDPEASPRRRPRRGTWANEYDSDLVDILDVVDPEVATLTTLTNMQNSLFIPDLGSFLNRRPTYNLTRDPTFIRDHRAPPAKAPSIKPPSIMTQNQIEMDADDVEQRPGIDRTFTIASHLSDTEDHYAVLPHGLSLEGWSAAEKQELNDHVRHMLHSRRAAFKRGMKGFGQYVRRPLGLFVTVYATLITLFGLAWVLFLIGWINVGGRQSYLINIIDNVLVALFAIVGDGLAPFRAVDTYHMIYIAHYHHLTWSLRKKLDLPKLKNENDLPVQPGIDADIETGSTAEAASVNDDAKSDRSLRHDRSEASMLTEEQQRKLKHHEDKFSKSHTFYKPHETETHHAFPLRLLVAVVVLLDCHSLLQIALGTCTWAISYHVRPFALTTVILCCSITCNISGGLVITIGDRMTRKKDVVERMFRQQLTEQAIHKMEKRRQKENERNEDLDEVVTQSPSNGTKKAPLNGTGLEPGSNPVQPRVMGAGLDAAQLLTNLP
ncbi:hypothetical protein E4T50_08962 [Aureobasidium sp. EXF-12298]|nr:hypothetical protein E4T50_08962 [Aureobasidium sp. EXF-12298]